MKIAKIFLSNEEMVKYLNMPKDTIILGCEMDKDKNEVSLVFTNSSCPEKNNRCFVEAVYTEEHVNICSDKPDICGNEEEITEENLLTRLNLNKISYAVLRRIAIRFGKTREEKLSYDTTINAINEIAGKSYEEIDIIHERLFGEKYNGKIKVQK